MQPKIQQNNSFFLKECPLCKGNFGAENYTRTKSIFYPDGYVPICNDCLKEYLIDKDFNWQAVDRLCQYMDIPFVPKEFEKLHKIHGDDVFPVYAEIFLGEEYEGLGWDDYFKEFQELKRTGQLEDNLPGLSEEKRAKLIKRWGANYDDESLDYLEQLHEGLLQTQNVVGALQSDQALKICKMSLEIDNRIRAGEDFDKLLASYEKTVKIAEFTPKNVKNANDFDSVGELIKWFEKKGFKFKYFDGVNRDIVDETIKNIQAYNRRLYTNESEIGEEITNRIEALERADRLEKGAASFESKNFYGDSEYDDLEDYENEGYNELIKEDGDFEVEVDGYEESI